MIFNESIVKDAALARLGELGYAVVHVSDITVGGAAFDKEDGA